MGTRLAYYTRGTNPLFFSQDSDKLTTNVPLEPSIYLLFTQMTLSQQNSSTESLHSDAVHVYIKQNVETFLFRGADLMWPGILSVSKSEFKPNATGVVYAHKALVKRYISSLAKEDERRQAAQDNNEEVEETMDNNGAQEENQEGGQDEQTRSATSSSVSLCDFIPICSGRMLTNGVPAGGPPKGKAVEIHHHLFDALWNIGNR